MIKSNEGNIEISGNRVDFVGELISLFMGLDKGKILSFDVIRGCVDFAECVADNNDKGKDRACNKIMSSMFHDSLTNDSEEPKVDIPDDDGEAEATVSMVDSLMRQIFGKENM